jgi:hypothetical protein
LHIFLGKYELLFQRSLKINSDGFPFGEAIKMKNSGKIAAFGVIGVLLLIAVAGVALASGNNPSASGNAYAQTGNMQGQCDGTHGRLMQHDQIRQMNCTCQGTGVCPNVTNGVCDGTQARSMQHDQTRQMNCTCQGTGVCPNQPVA